MGMRGGARGLSLTEVIISVFLLTAAVLLVIAMLHRSLRYQSEIERRALATVLAQKTLDQIRGWAWELSNYNSDWSPYDGVTLSDPDFPGYSIEVEAEPDSVELMSPCTELEGSFGARARRMVSSVVPVLVRVSWDPPSPNNSVRLFTYIGSPPPTVQSVVVSRVAGPGDPVPAEGVVEFTAEAFDADGNPIADVMFRWYVEPTAPSIADKPGLGTLVPPWGPQVVPPEPPGPRDGSRARLKHAFLRTDGVTWDHSPGFCRVKALAVLHGRETWGESLVELGP